VVCWFSTCNDKNLILADDRRYEDEGRPVEYFLWGKLAGEAVSAVPEWGIEESPDEGRVLAGCRLEANA
jgi:hypothetical protein